MAIPVFGEIPTGTGTEDLNTASIKVGSGTAAAPSIAIGETDNGFYQAPADIIRYAINGTEILYFGAGGIGRNAPAGVLISKLSSSATVPGYTFNDDTDTGVGRQAADNLSLIAGGVEAIRAEDPADLAAGETSLWLYDDDNGVIQQVTVGAADSGGAGYKVLRIVN